MGLPLHLPPFNRHVLTDKRNINIKLLGELAPVSNVCFLNETQPKKVLCVEEWGAAYILMFVWLIGCLVGLVVWVGWLGWLFGLFGWVGCLVGFVAGFWHGMKEKGCNGLIYN